MKKLLIACIVIVFALGIQAYTTDNTKALSDRMKVCLAALSDTVPSDTSKKDSLQHGVFAYNVSDTVPADTTKKDTMLSLTVAYRIVQDTIPTDTTKKDTAFQALAFNR